MNFASIDVSFKRAAGQGPALLVWALALITGCGVGPEHPSGTSGTATLPAGQTRSTSSGALTSSGPSGQASAEAGGEAIPSSAADTTSAAPAQLDLRIQFEAKVLGAPFACGQSFDGIGIGASRIDPVDFRFYVHDLRLIDLEGREVPATIPERELWQSQGVALLDFENDAGSCRFGGDAGLNDLVTASVPGGSYRGLRFSLGVPAQLNHQDPLTLGAPFQSGGMQWNWLTGFKFLALEFRSGESSGLLHIGSTACTGGGPKAIECSKSNRAEVFLPNFVPGVSRIAADLGAVFAQSDLRVDQICHSAEQSCVPMFTQAGVAWESGTPLNAQSFFSIAE